MTVNRSILALGANMSGSFGEPESTLRQIATLIDNCGLTVIKSSCVFATKPVGSTPQSDYVNAVVAVQSALPPARMLRLFKLLERQAGRRRGPLNGPRPLDIDLIDVGGRVVGWPSPGKRAHLVLPHPQMHLRAFVLLPLVQIAPQWHHPVLGMSATQLLARLPRSRHDTRCIGGVLEPEPALMSADWLDATSKAWHK